MRFLVALVAAFSIGHAYRTLPAALAPAIAAELALEPWALGVFGGAFNVVFAAMHPGWADTPGVRSSIPLFARITGPVLRTAEEGADTVVWLSATDREIDSGRFWCDREERPVHRLPTTRRADTVAARSALWDWCEEATAPYLV